MRTAAVAAGSSSHREAIAMPANRAAWSAERIEELKHHFNAGLSCSQIAREMGVTRNSIIGKMNRLHLSRPREVIAAQLREARAARVARPKSPRSAASKSLPKPWRPQRPGPDILAQQDMLAAAFPAAPPSVEAIHSGSGCTLLELSREKCRWPISGADAGEFRFCGNTPVGGSPYCLGHARLAYRPAGRRRSSAGG
jgi:GcrA cell cycle regulator